MIERKIWAAASILIDEHGKHAAQHAAQRARERLEAGDVEGSMVFRRVYHCVRELEATEPTGTIH